MNSLMEYSAQIQGLHSLRGFQEALTSIQSESVPNHSSLSKPDTLYNSSGIITAEEVHAFVHGKEEAALAETVLQKNLETTVTQLQSDQTTELITNTMCLSSGSQLNDLSGVKSSSSDATEKGDATLLHSSLELGCLVDGSNCGSDLVEPVTPEVDECEIKKSNNYIGKRLACSTNDDSIGSFFLAKHSPLGVVEKPSAHMAHMEHVNEEMLNEVCPSVDSASLNCDIAFGSPSTCQLPPNLHMLVSGLTHNQVLHLSSSPEAYSNFLSLDTHSVEDELTKVVEPDLAAISLSSYNGPGLMPAVEDGLSSGYSDVDSRTGSPQLMSHDLHDQMNDGLHSGSICGKPVEMMLPSSSAGGGGVCINADNLEEGGLVSYSLVQDITNDIHDIKRAIADNTDLPQVLIRSPDHTSQCHQQQNTISSDSGSRNRIASDGPVWVKR